MMKKIGKLLSGVLAAAMIAALVPANISAEVGGTITRGSEGVVEGRDFNSVEELETYIQSGNAEDYIASLKSIYMRGTMTPVKTADPIAVPNEMHIFVTPTYVSTDNNASFSSLTQITLYYYYDKSAAKHSRTIAEESATRVHTGKDYSVYYYAIPQGEAYYCWEQDGRYFEIRTNLIPETDAEFTAFAESACRAYEIRLKTGASGTGKGRTGWVKNAKGQRRYYKDGAYLTGIHEFPDGYEYKFNKNGICLGRRKAKAKTPAKADGEYTVVFGNNNNVKISDEKIAFDVKIDLKGRDNFSFGASPHFELFTYKDGKWVKVPYAYDAFTEELHLANEDGIMRFGKKFSDFDYDFTPGLYRVQVEVSGEVNLKTVTGEFNLV